MRIHRVRLLLLAILNFAATTYGNPYFVVPPVQGVNLYRNQATYQPAFANQPTSDKSLDILKEKLRNQVVIQNINRETDVSNNVQESALKSLIQRGQTVWQNNEGKIVNLNPQLIERLREQNSGNTAMQNGLDIKKNQYILERLRQTQNGQNVVPNFVANNNHIFDLLQQLNQQNRVQHVVQNVDRKLENFVNINPVATLEPNLQREQFVLQNTGSHDVLNPSIEDLIERLTQNNRGQLVVQNVDRQTPAQLHKESEESFVQNNNDKSVLVGLQGHNNGQIVMHNVKQKSLYPEINYLNPLVEPQILQHREKTMSQNIGQRPSRLNFGNIEEPKLQQPGQVLIQSVEGLSKHENSYLNSLLEQLKGHNSQVTIPIINPHKQRYQNNDSELIMLDNQQKNEHKQGLKHIINHKNYVSLNNNNIPFNRQVDYANRNLLMNIFIEKYIPENIKRILYNPRTKAEKEKVPMLLKNYKVITYAFSDFLRYSNPLAGYIKSLRIISENIKQRPKNDAVPVHVIQKEVDDLSQVGVDGSGFSIKKIGSNPDVFVEDLNLRVKDLPVDEEPLKKRPAINLNEETIIIPETNAGINIGLAENLKVTNQDTRLKASDYAMILQHQLNSEALHQTTTESVPLKDIEDLTVLHINEDAAPTVIGLDHHDERENYVLRDKRLDDIDDSNSRSKDITEKGILIPGQNNNNNSVVTQPLRPEIEIKESATKYNHDINLKENETKIARPNLSINTMINEMFCQSLDAVEVIDLMQEVLYNVMGELNEIFRLDGDIWNVARHAIMKTLHDKNLYSNKRCANYFGNTEK